MSGLLYAVLLKLQPLGERGPVRATGYHTYGLVLRLIATADPALGRALHADSPRKPLTVSTLLPPDRTRSAIASGEDGRYLVRVTLLQEDVFSALARGVLEHPPEQPVMLGSEPLRLEGLATQPAASPWAGISSFGELVARSASSEHLGFRWASPAVFRSGGERNVLFPEPGLVFGGLLEKWNAFCPPDLRLTVEKATLTDKLKVDGFQLTTRAVSFGSYTETGVQGWCSYRFASNLGQEERRAISTLAAFAPFAGVGAKTTMGLGQTMLVMPGRAGAGPAAPGE